MSVEIPPAIDETIEIGPEEIMESSREKRAALFQKVFNRKTAEAALVLAPGMDVLALTAFAARGETLAGQQLDNMDRFNYLAIASFLTLSYVCMYSGMNREALDAKGMAMALGAMQFGPQFIQKIKKIAQEKAPEVASFIEKTGGYIKDKQALVEDIKISLTSRLSSDPEFISLNLNA
jgi:hypothetical protein